MNCRGEILPILSQGRAQSTSVLPFITAFSKYDDLHTAFDSTYSAVLWTKYGLCIDDLPIIVVNVFGIFTSLWAIWMFHRCSSDRMSQVENEVLAHFIGIFAVLLLINVGVIGLALLSLLACGSSIFMYAAPLASMKEISRTKDTSSLSPRLISVTFVVCLVWLAYGLRIADRSVWIPNALGCCIAACQAAIIGWYGYRKRKDSLKPSGSIYEMLPIRPEA